MPTDYAKMTDRELGVVVARLAGCEPRVWDNLDLDNVVYRCGCPGEPHDPAFYCDSLDAAVSAVPDGWGYKLIRTAEGFIQAIVWPGSGVDIEGYSEAKPEARALCEALAMAGEGEEREQ